MNDYITGVLILIGISIIAVLGVSILTGFTCLFSFGNAGFMSVGAYTSALCSVRLGTPFLISILFGIAMSCLFAYLLGKLTLHLKGDYFLITTLGFGEGIRVLIQYLEKLTGGAKGLSGIPNHTTLPVVLIAVVLSILFCFNLIRSKYGRFFLAIREQEIAAEAVGVDTARFKLFSFVLSAALCGLAGCLLAHYMSFIEPKMFDFAKSSELTITVIIGGLGSLSGSILSAIFLTALPELLRSFNNYRMLIYGMAVLLVILLKPSGIMGYKEFSFQKCTHWIQQRTKRKAVESP